MLPIALGTMGLHMASGLQREDAETFQQRICAGRHETRRNDRLYQPRLITRHRADEVDQRSRIGDRLGGRGITVVIGTLLRVIHANAPDEAALPKRQADLGQPLRRRQVDRREVERRRGAVGEESLDQRGVDALGEGHIRVTALQRKSVRVQPIFQRKIERGAELRKLRGVNVQVD